MITNGIFWNGTSTYRNEIYYHDTDASPVSMTYSDVQGGDSGTGNMNADPSIHQQRQ